MRKGIIASLCLAAVMMIASVARAEGTARSEGPRIVATIFPLWDWTREILGTESADLVLLLDGGTDLHSYQPSVEDVAKICACDLLVCVGGESERWVEDALRNVTNEGQIVVCLLEALGDRVKDEEHEDHEHREGHGHHEERGRDEHAWLSLRNAELACRVIADALSRIGPARAEAYAANADRYVESLRELDDRYREVVRGASRRTILFADRFPFRYLVDDYGLTWHAAFPGCSAETEASFATVARLAGKVDELGLPCVLTVEGARHGIAQAVVASTKRKDQRVLVMDSMQGTTTRDAREGATYLRIMEKDLEVLKAALE